MTTNESLISLLKSLPEIDLTQVMEGLAEHLEKENLWHVTDGFHNNKIEYLQGELEDSERELTDAQEEISDLESEVRDLKSDIKDLEDEIKELEK